VDKSTSHFANRPDLRSPKRSLWLTGQMSPLAKKDFESVGWVVNEKAMGPAQTKDTSELPTQSLHKVMKIVMTAEVE
jgi:hypothetical protein